MDARSLLRLTLRPGSVYYFQERSFTSPEPHYFIVVNRQPLAGEILVLTVISSKVERVKRLRKELPGTIVEIGPIAQRLRGAETAVYRRLQRGFSEGVVRTGGENPMQGGRL